MSLNRWNTLRRIFLIRPLLLLDKDCPGINWSDLQDLGYLPANNIIIALQDFVHRDRFQKTINLALPLRALQISATQIAAATGISPRKLQALYGPRPIGLSYDELCAAEILLNYKTSRPVSPENLPFLHTHYADLLAEFDSQLSFIGAQIRALENITFQLRTADKRRYQERASCFASSPSSHPIAFHHKLAELLHSVNTLHTKGHCLIDHYTHL